MIELPKKRERKEADVDAKVAAYLYKHYPHSFALEVKIKGGRVLPHQVAALRQVTRGTFKPYKIRDMGARNPFDYIGLKNADALLCVVDKKHVICTVNENYDFSFSV